jgi:hypothetical protein
MMVKHHFGRGCRNSIFDHLIAIPGMELHDVHLFWRQSLGLGENLWRDVHFAHVVQQAT